MNEPTATLGIEEMPMYGPPRGKHKNGHQRPMTDREKRKAAEKRKAQLLAPVRPADAKGGP